MSNTISKFLGETMEQDSNVTMTLGAIASTAAASQAYLTATLEASTPEVRRLFSEYTTQSVLANEGLTALAVKNGWLKPYEDPASQLKVTFDGSKSILEE